MPYSISKLEDLPDYVQELSAKKRRQWVHVFNSAYASCIKEEDSDPKKCEKSAFAQANAAVKAGRRVRGLRVAQLRKLRQELEDLLGELNDVLGWAEYEDQQEEGVAYGFPIGAKETPGTPDLPDERSPQFKSADMEQAWGRTEKWLLQDRALMGRPKIKGVKFTFCWDGDTAELEAEGEMAAPATWDLAGIPSFTAKGTFTAEPDLHFWLHDTVGKELTLPERLDALKVLQLPEMFTVLAHRPIHNRQDFKAVSEWAARRPHSTGIVICPARSRAGREAQDMGIKMLIQLVLDNLDQDEPNVNEIKQAVQDIKIHLGFEEEDAAAAEAQAALEEQRRAEALESGTRQEGDGTPPPVNEWQQREDVKAASMSEKERRIRDAWYAKYRKPDNATGAMVEDLWVKDVFDDDIPTHLVVETSEGLLSYAYVFTVDDEIEFGEPVKGELVFRPTAKSLPAAIKILREDDKGVEVGGHLLLWGGPAKKDLADEYFTPETNLWLDAYKSVPCLFHHGLDDHIGLEVIGHRIKAVPDEVGVWVEHWLDKGKKFWAMVKPLLEAEGLYYSPGSAPHLVECEEDGRLKSFPVVEDTMTLIPCQHRLLPVEQLKAVYEAANIQLPDTLTMQQDDEAKRATTLKIAELEQQLFDIEA